MFRFFSSMALILFIAACAAQQQAGQGRYVLPEQPGGRMCVFQCRKAFDGCAQGCGFRKRACFIEMQTRAIRDYEDYMREQFTRRETTDLRVSDFERPEKCEEEECRASCELPYNACYKKCGGTVEGNPRPAMPPL